MASHVFAQAAEILFKDRRLDPHRIERNDFENRLARMNLFAGGFLHFDERFPRSERPLRSSEVSRRRLKRFQLFLNGRRELLPRPSDPLRQFRTAVGNMPFFRTAASRVRLPQSRRRAARAFRFRACAEPAAFCIDAAVLNANLRGFGGGRRLDQRRQILAPRVTRCPMRGNDPASMMPPTGGATTARLRRRGNHAAHGINLRRQLRLLQPARVSAGSTTAAPFEKATIPVDAPAGGGASGSAEDGRFRMTTPQRLATRTTRIDGEPLSSVHHWISFPTASSSSLMLT